MNRIIKKPVALAGVFLFFVLAGSNISCTSQASNNEEKVISEKNAILSVPGEVVPLTESTFDESIKSGIVLVDFYATWCRPCKMQSPIMEEVGKELLGKSTVFKVDIDKNPSIANRYKVVSIPTIVLFKDGKAMGQFVGLTQKEDIMNEVEKIANSK